MIFSSIYFIYYFLIIFLILYFITPKKYKNYNKPRSVHLILHRPGFFFIGTYASVECEQPYFLTTDDLNIIFTANILSSAQSNDACPPYFWIILLMRAALSLFFMSGEPSTLWRTLSTTYASLKLPMLMSIKRSFDFSADLYASLRMLSSNIVRSLSERKEKSMLRTSQLNFISEFAHRCAYLLIITFASLLLLNCFTAPIAPLLYIESM